MITNPPQNLDLLKEKIKDFEEKNSIDKKINLKINKLIKVNEIKEIYYNLYFYRKSKQLPGNWKPNNNYFKLSNDTIDCHKEDLIASITWYSNEPKKNYYVYDKSNNKNDYGKILNQKILSFSGN